jgi:hypothetical protein
MVLINEEVQVKGEEAGQVLKVTVGLRPGMASNKCWNLLGFSLVRLGFELRTLYMQHRCSTA